MTKYEGQQIIDKINPEVVHKRIAAYLPIDIPKAAAAPTTRGCKTYVFKFFELEHNRKNR